MVTERQAFRAIVEAEIPEEFVELNVGYLPWVLGENLAGQIDAWVNETGLGYYPALDYFRNLPEAVDPNLLLLTDTVADWCARYGRQELRRRLNRGFAPVSVEPGQPLAYTLPRVRPQKNAAPADLALHYRPNLIRYELLLYSRDETVPELQQLRYWLGDVFTDVNLASMLPG